MFEYLSGDDAQAFIDVIDEASISLFLPLKVDLILKLLPIV